jgi:hypothetical protein
MAKDWLGGTQNVMATLNASSHSDNERASNDYYATPRKAVISLLEMETFQNKIWECACGEGHISKVLTESGFEVFSSDLIDRGFGKTVDFLALEAKFHYNEGDIITNPPFAKANEFLLQAMDLLQFGCKLAMLLRIQFLEGVKRREIFSTFPPKTILVSSRNMRCAKNGDFENATGNASTYCWFIWEKGFTGLPQVNWF